MAGDLGCDPGPTAVDRRSPLPLWAQVAADLRHRLSVGAFTTNFPTEQRLVVQYRVSRHTVREALRDLRSSGVVVAERGRGSFVDRSRIEQPLGALYSLFRIVEEQGLEQRSEVLDLRETTDARVAAHLDLPPDAPLVILERLRLADGQPLALDTTWFAAQVAAPLLNVDFTHTAVYDELARLCGMRVVGGRERILPMVPDARQGALLRLRRHAAAFFVQRLGCADAGPVEWRESVVRGDRFAFVAEWSARHRDLELTVEHIDSTWRHP